MLVCGLEGTEQPVEPIKRNRKIHNNFTGHDLRVWNNLTAASRSGFEYPVSCFSNHPAA
jgi:hypothetical protein